MAVVLKLAILINNQKPKLRKWLLSLFRKQYKDTHYKQQNCYSTSITSYLQQCLQSIRSQIWNLLTSPVWAKLSWAGEVQSFRWHIWHRSPLWNINRSISGDPWVTNSSTTNTLVHDLCAFNNWPLTFEHGKKCLSLPKPHQISFKLLCLYLTSGNAQATTTLTLPFFRFQRPSETLSSSAICSVIAPFSSKESEKELKSL